MARRSKIGSLPFELREEVNQRLADGATGQEIIDWLDNLPRAAAIFRDKFDGRGLTHDNVSNWRDGEEYKDWLRGNADIDRTRRLSEFAMRLAKSSDGTLTERAAQIAAGNILATIEGLADQDLESVTKAIASLGRVEVASARVRNDSRRLANQESALALEQDKFRRGTAEMFLAWYQDHEAKAIAASGEGKSVKMDRLVQLMFGDRPDGL